MSKERPVKYHGENLADDGLLVDVSVSNLQDFKDRSECIPATKQLQKYESFQLIE